MHVMGCELTRRSTSLAGGFTSYCPRNSPCSNSVRVLAVLKHRGLCLSTPGGSSVRAVIGSQVACSVGLL